MFRGSKRKPPSGAVAAAAGIERNVKDSKAPIPFSPVGKAAVMAHSALSQTIAVSAVSACLSLPGDLITSVILVWTQIYLLTSQRNSGDFHGLVSLSSPSPSLSTCSQCILQSQAETMVRMDHPLE